MKRLVVTGARGFFGRAVVAQARARGLEVQELDLSGPEPVDLLDPAALHAALERHRPDTVLHLASRLKGTAAELMRVNAVGTSALLEGLREVVPKSRLLVVSSSAVYCASPRPLTEDDALEPVSAYGFSKLAQELLARQAFERRGADVVVVRPFNLVGPGMPAELAAGAFARRIANAERASGSTFSIGDTGAVRDFLDVRDAAFGLLELAERAPSGATFNLCQGAGVTVRACLDHLLAAASAPVTPVVDTGLGASGVPFQVGDPGRLAACIAWRPQISLAQSMRELLESVRVTGERT